MKKFIRMLIVVAIIVIGANVIVNNQVVGLDQIKSLLPWNDGSDYINTGDSDPVTNPSDFLTLVNREYSLSSDYVPGDLVEADVRFSQGATGEEKLMRKEAAAALESMFEAAKEDGVYLCGVSGYRSYESQKEIYDEKLSALGQDYVDKYVAVPGQSEHQTGLAMDVGIAGKISYDFESSREGAWISDNAQYYGFIIRYPKDKKNITGYGYEPWHVRYVGKKVAEEIESKNMVLEEYVNKH